jgi:hypothetical protein
MSSEGSCLGVCYADNHLFYSVNNPGVKAHLKHIGCIDFNFDVQNAIISGDEHAFPALKTSLENLRETYECSSVRILSPAVEECWTLVPRSVYEESDEREAHLQLLMHGSARSQIETVWHTVSNIDYRLLLLRNSSAMNGFNDLLGSFNDSEYVSEFELGVEWQLHSNINGAFLIIHCQKNYISVSSFILGKLRGCTYIRFDSLSDLPYLWNLYAGKISWMNGIHEEIYLFGQYSRDVAEMLTPFWDESGTINLMNNLNNMQVQADEETYGFRLESAYPAILMSLNLNVKEQDQT